MKYETLYANDNGTVKVRMTIDDHILEQDFDASDLDTNVKKGMAVFKSELERNASIMPNIEVGKTFNVTDLPTIPEEDFEQESSD